MNTKTIALIGIIVLIGGGFLIFGQQSSSKNLNTSQTTDVMEKNDVADVDAMVAQDPEESRYIIYSNDAYEKTVEKKKVLYFYANWCPTCKIANEEFTQKTDEIPEDIVVLRINYNDSDTDSEEKKLAKKYDITYQHTFVQVDENGEEITKWNGGGLSELVSRVK